MPGSSTLVSFLDALGTKMFQPRGIGTCSHGEFYIGVVLKIGLFLELLYDLHGYRQYLPSAQRHLTDQLQSLERSSCPATTKVHGPEYAYRRVQRHAVGFQSGQH